MFHNANSSEYSQATAGQSRFTMQTGLNTHKHVVHIFNHFKCIFSYVAYLFNHVAYIFDNVAYLFNRVPYVFNHFALHIIMLLLTDCEGKYSD